jgi:hypothetical protein
MPKNNLTPNNIPESDLSQALFAVSALVAYDVIQKAKQYNTLILIMDEHGNIQRLHPESFESSFSHESE